MPVITSVTLSPYHLNNILISSVFYFITYLYISLHVYVGDLPLAGLLIPEGQGIFPDHHSIPKT